MGIPFLIHFHHYQGGGWSNFLEGFLKIATFFWRLKVLDFPDQKSPAIPSLPYHSFFLAKSSFSLLFSASPFFTPSVEREKRGRPTLALPIEMFHFNM